MSILGKYTPEGAEMQTYKDKPSVPKTVNTVSTASNIFNQKTDDQKPVDDNAKMEVIGGAIKAGGALAGGIMQGVQYKRQREEGELQSMADLAQARVNRERQLDVEREQIQLGKERAQFEILKANTGLRLDEFARDLQKQQQKFEGTQKHFNKVKERMGNDEGYRDMMAQLLGGAQ